MPVQGEVLVLALLAAVAAAVRSTWSPCGTSMLSTITPVSERGRGHRYGGTASWFVIGALLGGLTLGGACAALAALVASATPGPAVTLAAAAALCLAAAAVDLDGRWLPAWRRQVNDQWLDRYRAWVYGIGFGWQIGVGVATYIMTAGVGLLVALAALTGSPLLALAVGALFGGVRGLAVLLTARVRSPEDLRDFHRRFDRLGPRVRGAVIAVEVALAAVAAGALWPPAAALALGAALLVAVATARATPLAARSGARSVAGRYHRRMPLRWGSAPRREAV